MAQWQLPNPKDSPSTDKYALDSAQAYGYSKFYTDTMSYLNNLEATLKQLVEQEQQDEEAT